MKSEPHDEIVPVHASVRSRGRTSEYWTGERRQALLVRADVEVVLSADENMTPILLSAEDTSAMELLVSAVPTPGGMRGYQRLKVFMIDPDSIEGRSRRLLGYDVIDDMRYSALLDCRNELMSTEALSTAFATKLNEWHLFDSTTDADDLVVWADEAIAEHAPFCVVAVEVLD
jgi:hypothetical protein